MENLKVWRKKNIMTSHFNVLPLSNIHSTRHWSVASHAQIYGEQPTFSVCVWPSNSRDGKQWNQWQLQSRGIEANPVFRKKVAESTRSLNHRHRELIGNSGFFSLVCSFSLHSGEWERSPCLWTCNAGQWKVCTCCVWQCWTSHRHWFSLSALHGLSDVEITLGRYRQPSTESGRIPYGYLGPHEKMAILCGPHMILASFDDWGCPYMPPPPPPSSVIVEGHPQQFLTKLSWLSDLF